MQITILNGDTSSEASAFTSCIDILVKSLEQEHEVNPFFLKNMDIHECIGCWNCFWKTPGICIFNDDGQEVCRRVINSDIVIFASPLIAGFTTALLKKATDRFVSLIHPYTRIVEGEVHHRKRYDSYPDIAVLYSREKDTDENDIDIIKSIYQRMSINFNGELLFVEELNEHSRDSVLAIIQEYSGSPSF